VGELGKITEKIYTNRVKPEISMVSFKAYTKKTAPAIPRFSAGSRLGNATIWNSLMAT